MAREQVTTVPRRQARGGHVACAPAAGRVSDLSTEAQAPARDNHRGQGMGHLQVCTHVTGVPPRPRTTRHAAPTPKAPCEATAVKTAWARTSPHLQRCDCGVDGPGAGDDGPPAAGEGTMLPAHQLQGELAISVPRHRHPRATITAGRMGHLEVYTHVTGVPRPSAHNAARSPDPRKLLARPLQSKPRGLRRRLTCNGATVG